MEGFYELCKHFLYTFNAILELLAIILVVFGLIAFDDFHRLDSVYRFSSGYATSIIIMLIGVGILIVSLVGIYGTMREDKPLMNIYAKILPVAALLMVIVASVYYSKCVQAEHRILDLAKDSLKSDKNMTNNSTSNQDLLNNLQLVLQCCGVNSPQDWEVVFNETGLYSYSCCKNGTKEDLNCTHLDFEKPCSKALSSFFSKNKKPLLWALCITILAVPIYFLFKYLAEKRIRQQNYIVI